MWVDQSPDESIFATRFMPVRCWIELYKKRTPVRNPRAIDIMVVIAVVVFTLVVVIYLGWQVWRMFRIDLPG